MNNIHTSVGINDGEFNESKINKSINYNKNYIKKQKNKKQKTVSNITTQNFSSSFINDENLSPHENFLNFSDEFHSQSFQSETISKEKKENDNDEDVIWVNDNELKDEDQNTTKKESSDIIELFTIQKSFDNSARNNYYDDNDNVDTKQLLKRWNIKKLANANVNMSCCNYRFRLFGENTTSTRSFKPKIFLDENGRFLKSSNQQIVSSSSSSSKGETSSMNNDELVLQDRIAKITFKSEQIKEKCKQIYLASVEGLNLMHHDLIFQNNCLSNSFEIKEANEKVINDSFNDNLNKITTSYQTRLQEINDSNENEINALTSLVLSGNYKKGKLHEYATLEVYQPRAKRRKYDDDGYRQVYNLITTFFFK